MYRYFNFVYYFSLPLCFLSPPIFSSLPACVPPVACCFRFLSVCLSVVLTLYLDTPPFPLTLFIASPAATTPSPCHCGSLNMADFCLPSKTSTSSWHHYHPTPWQHGVFHCRMFGYHGDVDSLMQQDGAAVPPTLQSMLTAGVAGVGATPILSTPLVPQMSLDSVNTSSSSVSSRKDKVRGGKRVLTLIGRCVGLLTTTCSPIRHIRVVEWNRKTWDLIHYLIGFKP